MLEPVASLSACDTPGVTVVDLNTAFERPRDHSLAGHQPDIEAEPQRSACWLNGLQISVREITLNDFAHHLIVEAPTPANAPRHAAQTSDQRITELRRGITAARNSRKPRTNCLYEQGHTFFVWHGRNNSSTIIQFLRKSGYIGLELRRFQIFERLENDGDIEFPGYTLEVFTAFRAPKLEMRAIPEANLCGLETVCLAILPP